MKLWIVGEVRETLGELRCVWDLVGVFDNEQLAVDACESPMHFVGRVDVNAIAPKEPTALPGAWYPKANDG